MKEFMDLEVHDLIKSRTTLEELESEYRVYFLLKNNEVVYVGKSVNYINRIKAHLKDKDFDSFNSINLKNELEMDIMELYFIDKFNPIYNSNLPHHNLFMSLNKIKNEFNLNAWKLKKFIRLNNIQPVFRLRDQAAYRITDFEKLLRGEYNG